MAKAKSTTLDPVAVELAAIKQLLIVSLIRDGVKQKHIAAALGVHDGLFRRASLPR
jgi:hypothetical protein